MLKFLPLLLFPFVVSLLPAQTLTGSFEYDGLLRDYRLFVPGAYDGSEPWPLVFNLHGYTSNASQQELYSQMNVVADTGHFLVCYPNGILNSWNVSLPGGSSADDVGFINALIDTLSAHYLIDPERVFSCGMSNGGFMSYKLACELTDRFAAIASVTGSMVPTEAALCNPTHPIPVLEIHGTADPVVPYAGLAYTMSIPDLLTFWTGKNGCVGDPEVIPVADINFLDGCTAELIQYNDCSEGAEVWHYKVYNGGHTWPGAPIIVGVTNQDFDASLAIWEFFLRHSPAGPSAVEETAVEKMEIAVFPNPFSEALNIRLPDEEMIISVFNSLGQLVWMGSHAGSLSMETSQWPSGAYWLVARGENGFFCASSIIKI